MKPKTYAAPAANRPSARAADFFKSVQELAMDLYERWQDEHEYEDLSDYALPLRSAAEPFGVTIRGMSARGPWGFTFEADNRTYRLTVNRSQIAYRRIA